MDATGPKHFALTLTRSKLEALTAASDRPYERALLKGAQRCRLTPEQIDEVLLVGGMTRMPAVQEMVKSIFKKEPTQRGQP